MITLDHIESIARGLSQIGTWFKLDSFSDDPFERPLRARILNGSVYTQENRFSVSVPMEDLEKIKYELTVRKSSGCFDLEIKKEGTQVFKKELKVFRYQPISKEHAESYQRVIKAFSRKQSDRPEPKLPSDDLTAVYFV